MTTQIYELTDLGIRVFQAVNTEVPIDKILRFRYTHKHGYYELHIILEGECMLQAEDAIYPVKAGQFALVAPGVLHMVSSEAAHNGRYCTSFEVMKHLAPTAEKLEQHTKENPIWVGDASSMMDIVRRLQKEADQNQAFSNEIRHILNEILVLDMLRAIETRTASPRPVRNDSDEARSLLIDIFLNSNFHLTAGEEVLAEHLGLSRRQLGRVLQKLYGKSYREMVLDIRFQAACDLLRHSNLSVREISEQVGYSTPSNFTTFFKSVRGITPGQYREEWEKCDILP